MKLYYAPGACSLSPHIALREAGLPFALEKVDTKTKTTETGADFTTVNPRGYVPALELDNGEVLTEGAAIVQYIADLKPEAEIAPKAGTLARARLQEELNFVSSELHKGFSPLFNTTDSEANREAAKQKLARRFDNVEAKLADGRSYLLGERFSVADGYLFTVANWGGHVGFPLDRWPKVRALMARVAERATVQAAMQAEGLVK
ncbi:glutathione transferase GstA [Bosea sp. (in: a-proteobacteria)]|uniref:Glutathione transferase GstA n=1 Tax=Bosea vestrisii TaxID=151416 RepID=A0ABW0HJZ3_9HYPH|nr:glutathione transferase GstA [Bosea sp. (in: a-proteobacteria)]MBA4223859.1 glutathione transferase GstA [Methylobacterium sp.]MBR3190021.1 glutathione transferase GstA [Bosea sp. (in: a-proteobacteria)]